MTSRTDLDALQLVADRSNAGLSVPVESLTAAGFDVGNLRSLLHDGLIDLSEEGGNLIIVLTTEGRDVLRPGNSL